jgi:Proteasome subunit
MPQRRRSQVTIAVGVACPEGLVLAADSRSSLLSNNFRIATDYADKLFPIGDRFAAVTSGWATLQGKTIGGVLKEFVAQTTISSTIDEAAAELRDHVLARMQAHIEAGLDPAPANDVLTFVIGGFDDQGVGHLKAIFLPSGTIADGPTTTDPFVVWHGDTEIINRTFWGHDVMRLNTSKWAARHRQALEGVAYIVPCRWFALQDAVDFALMVVRTTIDVQRFTNGTLSQPGSSPTCGGPVQIAVLTAQDGLRWVQRTTLRGDDRLLKAEGFLEA